MSTANVRLDLTSLSCSKALSFDALPGCDSERFCCRFGGLIVDLAVEIQDFEPERENDSNSITSLPPCDL